MFGIFLLCILRDNIVFDMIVYEIIGRCEGITCGIGRAYGHGKFQKRRGTPALARFVLGQCGCKLGNGGAKDRYP